MQMAQQFAERASIDVRKRVQQPLVHLQLALVSHVRSQTVHPLGIQLVGQQGFRQSPEEALKHVGHVVFRVLLTGEILVS